MKKIAAFTLIASAMLIGFAPAHASEAENNAVKATATAVVPEAGLWGITDELNGAPGRGFQLDTQGDTLVMSFYGYKADGTPTFYLSSGKFDTKGYTGQLMEYRNGTAFGQAFRNGQETGSAGTAILEFNNSTSGTITLPGEASKPIKRFVFADISSKFHGQIFYSTVFPSTGERAHNTRLNFSKVKDGALAMTSVGFGDSDNCTYNGSYTAQGPSIDVAGNYACGGVNNGTFTLTNMTVDPLGNFSGILTSTITATGKASIDQIVGR